MQNCFALEVRAKVKQQQQQQHAFGKERIDFFAQGRFNSFGKHHRCDVNDYVVPTSQLECTLLGMQMSRLMPQLTTMLVSVLKEWSCEKCSLLNLVILWQINFL